jgi:hypothetical protein
MQSNYSVIFSVKHKEHTLELVVVDNTLMIKGELVGMTKLMKYYSLIASDGKLSRRHLKIFKKLSVNYLYGRVRKPDTVVKIMGVKVFSSKVFVKHLLPDFSKFYG